MNLELYRYNVTAEWSAGLLFLRGDESSGFFTQQSRQFICHILERPWLDNQSNVSCIPDGTYSMAPWRRPTNEDWVFIVDGGSVVRSPDQINVAAGYTRWGILFHTGNTVDDSHGCLLPGLGCNTGKVTASRDGMAKLKRTLAPYFSQNPDIPLVIKTI